MEGYIYLTKEINSDSLELMHEGLQKIGIGKSINPFRRFCEHHNRGSKSTTGVQFLDEFKVNNMDHVENELHRILKSLGYYVVNRHSINGDNFIKSKTEVFSGRHIDTNEEISEKLIFNILESVVSGDEYISITKRLFTPHFLQEVAIRQMLDSINMGVINCEYNINIIAELCARFGKTLTYLELFRKLEDKDVMIIPSYMHSVFSSFEDELKGRYKDEKIGKWSNFSNYKIIDTREDFWFEKYKQNLGKSKLVVFVSIQTDETSFSKFDLIRDTDTNKKFVVIDEADFGAHTTTSQKVIDYIAADGLKIATSGTGIDRASKIFLNKKISDIISVSYTEMLLSKKGNSKYFSQDFIYELDPVKNKNLFNYLKSVNVEDAIKSLSYAPDINFFKLVLPKKHRDLIHSELDSDDLTGWSKILSDVDKNQSIIKSIISGLWGKAGVKDDILNTLAIHNAIEKEAKVVQFFVGTPTNKQLSKLSKLFSSVLPNYIIRTLSGEEDATNAISQELVKEDIKKSKEEGKDGVIIISKDMGSRSFSVSETDAVVLMYDNGSVSSLVQKISRALTGGLDYYGNEKTCGNIISLSLDPNRVDAVDIYVVEEAQKNKIQSESFLSSLRRIRRSVNIFSIDENSDRIPLLEKDEYYTELMEKFSFERLKNSQINILPLISDKDFRSVILGIKSSELSKNEKKVALLKGKGKKYLDDAQKSKNDDEDSDENDFSKADIELLRQAILTINNSLLSIVAIDDSIRDKTKSFRSILKSIDSDVSKTKEFYELFGIRASVVVTLMDKEVINEQIIDICVSQF